MGAEKVFIKINSGITAEMDVPAPAADLMNPLILYSINSEFYMKSLTVGNRNIFRTASSALRADLGVVGDSREMQAACSSNA